MKIKTDFVTNSSSASFVIAIRKGLTKKDIQVELLKDKKRLEGFIKDQVCYDKNYLIEDSRFETLETIDDKINLVAELLSEVLFIKKIHVIDLGDFIVFGKNGSSEDADLFSNWLFGYSSNDTENLKIKGFN